LTSHVLLIGRLIEFERVVRIRHGGNVVKKTSCGKGQMIFVDSGYKTVKYSVIFTDNSRWHARKEKNGVEKVIGEVPTEPTK
jgi:hypothetical protein